MDASGACSLACILVTLARANRFVVTKWGKSSMVLRMRRSLRDSKASESQEQPIWCHLLKLSGNPADPGVSLKESQYKDPHKSQKQRQPKVQNTTGKPLRAKLGPQR